MSVLIAVCLVVSLATAVQPCCFPSDFEAGISFTQGSIDANGTGHYTEGYGRITFDETNQIVSTDQTLTYDGMPLKQRLVLDYKKGIAYRMASDGCSRTALGPWLPTCIPSNSTATRNDFTYGLGDNALDASSYYLQLGGFEIYLAVTRDSCAPIAEDIISKAAGGQMMQTIVFDGITTGINDRRVFNVPSGCDASPVGPAYPGMGRRRSFIL